MSEILQWVAGAVALLLSLACIVLNYFVWFRYLWNRKPGSMVPVVGAVFGAAAILILPLEGLAVYVWIPFVLDPGALPLLVSSVVGARISRD